MLPQLSLEWSRRAAQTFGSIGENILRLQDDLKHAGHELFAADQSALLSLAETQQEVEEYGTYQKEIAKETIGAIWNPGSVFSAGDGFVSPYLESLRQRRDREWGARNKYDLSIPGRWKFEINGLMARLQRLQETDETAYNTLMDEKEDRVQAARRHEESALFGRSEDGSGFDTNIERRFQSLLDGLALSSVRATAIESAYKINNFVPIVGFPIGDRYTFGMCLTDVGSFVRQRGLCILDHKLFLAPGAPDQVVGHQLADFSIHELRFGASIPGFDRYNVATTFGGIALGVVAQLRLMELTAAAVEACVLGWEEPS